ncbi:MAG: hypothetical protein LBI86_02340 [Treponema sp.]|jgi:hypothetical protein|nr:hypothetical protein [Treponema sp.]
MTKRKNTVTAAEAAAIRLTTRTGPGDMIQMKLPMTRAVYAAPENSSPALPCPKMNTAVKTHSRTRAAAAAPRAVLTLA